MAIKHAIETKDGISNVNLTPMRAIRMKCLECSNWQWAEIRDCNIPSCALWVYRFGKKPDQAKKRGSRKGV